MAKTLKIYSVDGIKDEVIDRTLTSVEVEPTQEEQVITAPEGYNGFNEVKVKGARLQQKIVTPSKETQVIKADEGYYGLSDVIVSPPVIDGEEIIKVVNTINTSIDNVKNNVDSVKSDIEASTNTINENFNIVKKNLDNTETNINDNIDETEKTIITSIANSLDMKNVVIKIAKESQKWDRCYNLFSTYVFNDGFEALADLGYELELLKPYTQSGEMTRNPSSLFYGNALITKLPKLILNLWSYDRYRPEASNVFGWCTSLKEVDVTLQANGNSYYVKSIFDTCTSLEKITIKFNGNANTYSYDKAFYNCNVLETIDGTLGSIYTATSMFYNCYKLKNVTFSGIYTSITIGYGSTYGHLLTIDSLLSACRAMYNGLTLTVGSANLEKLANVYVDSNGYQVDSSTEGAITVSQYMSLKSCTLA